MYCNICNLLIKKCFSLLCKNKINENMFGFGFGLFWFIYLIIPQTGKGLVKKGWESKLK